MEEIFFSIGFLFLSFLLNIVTFSSTYEFIDEEFGVDSEMPGNLIWISLCTFIPVWNTYISWGTLNDEGILYLIGFVLGTVAISIAPMILFFAITGIVLYLFDLTEKQQENIADTIQSYQILIGAILITLAILFVA